MQLINYCKQSIIAADQPLQLINHHNLSTIVTDQTSRPINHHNRSAIAADRPLQTDRPWCRWTRLLFSSTRYNSSRYLSNYGIVHPASYINIGCWSSSENIRGYIPIYQRGPDQGGVSVRGRRFRARNINIKNSRPRIANCSTVAQ